MSESQANNVVITSDPTFESDVYGRSSVVILDFWASWCAPCRMLMPLLEKVAKENSDWVTLIKVNTDECPVAAGNFGIQGIPAVYAILGNKVIDQFQGALPESAIRQWLVGLKPKWELSQLDAFSKANPQEALQRLQELVAKNPEDESLVVRLAERLSELGRFEEAGQAIERLERRGFLEPTAARIKAKLSLQQRANSCDVEALRREVERSPNDFATKLKLAEALAGSANYVEACEIGLQLIGQDRRLTGEKARELLVDIFRVLPEDSEITSKYRRQLALALY